MFRMRLGRLGTVAVSAMLSVTLLGVGSSFAANSRDVDFGSPGAYGGDVSGTTLIPGALVFSPVTASSDASHPGRTAVQVEIHNAGGQTLNHVKFAGGDVADVLPYNPDFTVQGTDPPAPHPSGPSFPTDTSLNAVFPPTGCSYTSGGVLCDVGTLAANTSKTYTLVFTPPQTAGEVRHIWLTASWAEGWSSSGTNADYAFAEGDIHVAAAGCTTPTSSYFLPNEIVGLASGLQTCDQAQTANVGSGKKLDPNGFGTFAQVGVDSNVATDWCPTGFSYTCYGSTVSVEILSGDPVPGGVLWTIKWYGTKSLGGVVHFWDSYDASDPLHSADYTTIPFTKKFQCSASRTTDCWVSGSLLASKGNADPLWFQATFVTANNGKGGGFI